MMRRAKLLATIRGSTSRAAICLAAGMFTACGDGLLHEPAPPAPGRVSLSASVLQGGTAEAYAQTNVLWLQFSDGEETRLEQTVAFDAGAEEVRVPIQVPLRATTETLLLRFELRRNTDAIFQGSAEVTLTAGQTAEVDMPLQPVVAGVSCGGTDVLLDAYGATAQLTAAALFATGDTVPSASVQWSTASEGPITVNDVGLVTAQQDGTATVTCAASTGAGNVTDTRTVVVLAAVTSVAMAPGQAAILVGGTQAFTATARDRLQNVISGRTTTWTSAAPAIAQVNQAGTATGVSAGTARIDATIDGVTGSGTLTVSFLPPSVTTQAASGITRVTATFNGTANPQGAATSAWFEYGTSPTLATFTATGQQAVGAGSANVAVSQPVSGLSESTTYYVRLAASSAGGTTRGQIVSFTTLAPPPPSVTTQAASGITRVTATFNGTANPQGAATSAWFEYGTSPTLATFTATGQQAVGAGSANVAVSQPVSGLSESTTYYVRIAASSAGGTTRGQIVSFATLAPPPPSPTTLAASGITGVAATLNGTANPEGTATSAWFEYGTSPTLTTFTATGQQAVGAGSANVAVSQPVSGLSEATTYYVRIAASSAAGTTRGQIVSFRTLAPGPPSVRTVAAAYVPNSDAFLEMSGAVTPNGADTSFWFEYSYSDPTLTQPSTTPIQRTPAGWTEIPFGDGFYGQGTEVWVRAVAQNQFGIARGAIIRAEPAF